MFVNVFSLFRFYLPLEYGMTLHLNKHDFPSPKDALCQVWLKLALWFLRRRFLKFVNVFSPFPYYLPLEKGGVLHLNKLESPSPKNALCQVWLKLASGSWEEDENVKSLQTDGRTTDIRRSEKLTWAFSSGEIKTTRKKVSVGALGLLSSFTCAWARKLSSIYKNTTQAHWVSSTWLRWRTFWCW